MASAATLEIIINAKNQASKALDQVSQSSGGLGSKLKALAGGLAVAGAGFASFEMLKGAVDSTQELGLAVSKLSRETGLSTEASSHLIFGFKHVGLDAADASKSIGIFAKKLEGVSDSETGVLPGGKAMSAYLKELGVNALDTTGHILPLDQILGPLADKVRAMPNGLDKTALAMNLFGRSGKDMIPLLNLGASGMDELSKQADKLGMTLSAKNVEQIKQYTFAHRDMEEAIAGVKLQIGLALMPVLTKFAMWFTENQPQIRAFVQEGIEKARIVVQNLTPVVQALLPPIESFGKFIVNNKVALMALIIALGALLIIMNPIPAAILGIILVVGFLAQHWDWIKAKTLEVWNAIKGFFEGFVSWLRDHWVAILVGALTGPVGLAFYLFRDDIRGVVDAVVSFFEKLPGRIMSAISGLGGKIAGELNPLNHIPGGGAVGKAVGAINPFNAAGTPYWRGGPTWVGERGPELVNIPRGAQILSNRDSMAVAGGGVTNHFEFHITADSEIGEQAGQRLARQLREEWQNALTHGMFGGSRIGLGSFEPR